jgi:2-keto-3-deoxy-L-rhamnonate aldolase RhmA
MNRNSVKRRLSEGETVVGPYIAEFFTAGLPQIVASAGADFLIFDYEHSGWTSEALRAQIALARGAGLVPIVNSPGRMYEREGLLLDMGAMGLLVPHIETEDDARAVIDAITYAPGGHRGASFGLAHDGFSTADIPATIREANDSTLVIVKLESGTAIENAEKILSLPGIDGALVTGFDLSLDLGLSGDLDHPRMRQARSHVLNLCQRLGKAPACAAFGIEAAHRCRSEGYRFIQYSWDVGLFQEALREGIAAVQSSASNPWRGGARPRSSA